MLFKDKLKILFYKKKSGFNKVQTEGNIGKKPFLEEKTYFIKELKSLKIFSDGLRIFVQKIGTNKYQAFSIKNPVNTNVWNPDDESKEIIIPEAYDITLYDSGYGNYVIATYNPPYTRDYYYVSSQ